MDSDEVVEQLLDKYEPAIPRGDRIFLSSTLETELIEFLASGARANFLSLPDKVGYAPEFRSKCREVVSAIKRKGYPVIDVAKVDVGTVDMETVVKVSSKDPRHLPLSRFREFSKLSFFDSSSIPIPEEYHPDFSMLWNRYHKAHLFLFESLAELLKYTQMGRNIIARFSIKLTEDTMMLQQREETDLKKEYLNAISLINPVIEKIGCEKVESRLFIRDKKNADLLVVAKKNESPNTKAIGTALKKLDVRTGDGMYA